MKCIAILWFAGTMFVVATNLRADEPVATGLDLSKLAKSVELDAKAPAADIKPTMPRPGSERILCRLKIEATEGSSPKSFYVSGRVVSDNTNAGLERVAIFLGQEAKAPELAAMTNADGDFKFRLWVNEDQRSRRVQVPPDFSGYLYVGGNPSLTYRNVLRLMSGYALRYKLAELAKLNQLELPIPPSHASSKLQKVP